MIKCLLLFFDNVNTTNKSGCGSSITAKSMGLGTHHFIESEVDRYPAGYSWDPCDLFLHKLAQWNTMDSHPMWHTSTVPNLLFRPVYLTSGEVKDVVLMFGTAKERWRGSSEIKRSHTPRTSLYLKQFYLTKLWFSQHKKAFSFKCVAPISKVLLFITIPHSLKHTIKVNVTKGSMV